MENTSPIRIAIATEKGRDEEGKYWVDDAQLKKKLEELHGKNVEVQILEWQSQTDWNFFDSIFISSTWNIPSHTNEFIKWVEECSTEKKRLINDSRLIIDNVIKSRYYSLLNEKLKEENSLIPSFFYSTEANEFNRTKTIGDSTLSQILESIPELKGKDIVLKPIVSADGNNTFIYNQSGNSISEIIEKRKVDILESEIDAEKQFQAIIQNEKSRGIILQPYIRGIEEGEYSLVFFNNEFSHAVIKPKGFKNSDSKLRQPFPVTSSMIDVCQKALAILEEEYGKEALTRIRVDVINDNGSMLICEIECTEPNINMSLFKGEEHKRILTLFANTIWNRTKELREAKN